MKTTKLFSRLFAVVGLLMVFVVSGWADTEPNNACDEIEQISEMHNQTGTYSHNETGSVASNDPDYYYFTIPQSGTLTYAYTSTANSDLRVQVAGGCTTTMPRILNNGTSLTSRNLAIGAGDTVRFHIARRNGTPNYTLTLSFRNNTPTDITLSNNSIAENQPVGTNIGTLSATDPDTLETFTYTLVSGTGSTDNSSFTILGNSLRSNATFDYETKNNYSIRVRVTDSVGNTREEVFTVNITDIAEAVISCSTLRDEADLTDTNTRYTNSANYNNSSWNVGPSSTGGTLSRAYRFTVDRPGSVAIDLSRIDRDQARFSVAQGACPTSFQNLTSTTVGFSAAGDFYVYIYYVSGANNNIEHQLDVVFTPSILADAFEDNFETLQGTPISGNVLINDLGAGKTVISWGNPSNGTLTGTDTTGNFIYTPTAGYTGTDSFSYTISDSYGNTDGATVTIDVVLPNAGAASNDSYSIFLTNTLEGNVLANDTGSGIILTSNTLPSNGSLSISPFGNFTYNANSGFVGTDSFIYTITDANGNNDSASVRITVTSDTEFNSTSESDFLLVNPPSTRNIVGDFKLAGNTVLCLTELTTGYGGTCHDADYQFETSNNKVVKYLDIDADASTWNSTSSSINFPTTFQASDGQKIVWAGLFWQGRLSWDDDYPVKYAQSNGGITETSIGQGAGVSSIDITTTNANKIKLKVDNGNYNDVQASQVYSLATNGGVTYAAFADVTTVLRNANLSAGNHLFTTANLTTGIGREVSPGLFGGWSLAVIYQENFSGKLRNISLYNGFVSIGTNNNPIQISGFRLPTNVSESVSSQLGVFSGEGEHLYGRTVNSNSQDWMKISNDSGSGYQYMPGLVSGTGVGNRDNMFNAQLQNISRPALLDNSGNNLYNNLAINNVGVDIDFFDVSQIMTNYRNADPDLHDIYISLYSNNDYITPSMLAFSTELYKPDVCYDFAADRNLFTLPPQGSEINATFNINDTLGFTIALLSMEGDVDLTRSTVSVDVRPKAGSVLAFDASEAYYSPRNSNILLSTPVTAASSASFPQIAVGKDRDPLSGGTIGSYERYYSKFNFNVLGTNDSRIEADFTIELNTTIDYGSGPITQVLPIERCDQSPVYNPVFLDFNVERIGVPNNGTASQKYPLHTQIAGRDFDYSVASYGQDGAGQFVVPLVVDDKTVDVELISASAFDDNTSFLKCANPSPDIIIGGFGNSPFIHFNNQIRVDVAIPDDLIVPRALENAIFRMWILADVNDSIISHNYNRTDGAGFRSIYLDNFATFDTNGNCATACDTANGVNGNPSCYNCLRSFFAKPICSRDNFAIRPESFRIGLNDNDENSTLGSRVSQINKNNTTNFSKIAAEYIYPLEINATLFNESGVAQKYYNDSFRASSTSTLPNKLTTNIAALEFDTSTGSCSDTSNYTMPIAFAEGLAQYQFSHNNVGNYKIWIDDNNWTKVDQSTYVYQTRFDGRPHDDCVLNDISIPSTGTVGCVTSSINPASNYTEMNLDINPYQFNLNDIVFSTSPTANSPYLYMNNLNDSRNMAAKLEGNITAEGKLGTRLTNYTSSCAAEDALIWVDHNITGIGYNENIILDENSSTVLFQQQLLDNAGTVQAPLSNTDNNITFSRSNFLNNSDYNGSASVDLYFNFQKPYNTVVNPVDVNFTLLNAIAPLALSNVHLVSNYAPDGNQSLNQSRSFLYGKVAPKLGDQLIQTYDEIYSTQLRVNIFCRPDLASGVDCLFPFAIGASEDDISSGPGAGGSWYRMTLHNGATDGGITSLSDNPVSGIGGLPRGIDLLDDNNGSTPPDITLTWTGARPKSTEIIITPDVWLKYNPFTVGTCPDGSSGCPTFSIDFLSQGLRWKGEGKTGHVIGTEPGARASERMNW